MLGEATSHQREPGCTTPRCMVASTLHYRVATCLVKNVEPSSSAVFKSSSPRGIN